MYEIIRTTKFKKDLKRILKRSELQFDLAFTIIEILEHKGVAGIPDTMKPHKLKGKYQNDWECHIKPDLLIIWFQIESPKKITLIRIGSHSDLF